MVKTVSPSEPMLLQHSTKHLATDHRGVQLKKRGPRPDRGIRVLAGADSSAPHDGDLSARGAVHSLDRGQRELADRLSAKPSPLLCTYRRAVLGQREVWCSLARRVADNHPVCSALHGDLRHVMTCVLVWGGEIVESGNCSITEGGTQHTHRVHVRA